MNPWLLVALIVASTTVGDILQSHEMKRHGEIDNLSPRGIAGHISALARRPLLAYAFLCMAISFFSFMLLLSVADLSFAVPATAASYVLETVLAKLILKERIDYRRWAGAVLVAAGVALLAV
jgi:drug/metabolite transporter (DMT)-like permease